MLCTGGDHVDGRSALGVLCAAQFVFILDVAVVNVALVPLALDLQAEPDRLQLVASCYAATFGGLLLVGGRVADGRGRRRTFTGGLVVFAVASAVCAVAVSVPVLLAGRALQGAGAAFASPAALSLLTTVFAEGPARSRALGTWAAVAAGGGAAGLVLGGVLTASTGWRTVFLVNLPVIAAIVVMGLRVLPPGVPAVPHGPQVRAAVSSVAAVVLLVGGLGVLEAGGSVLLAAVLVVVAAAAAATFLRADRGPGALLPVELRRSRSVLTANAVSALMSVAVIGVNFFLAVHLQQRLGLSAVLTGLAFLPITAVSAVTSVVAARVAAARGVRAPLVAGMLAVVAGCLLLAWLPDDGAYLAAVLPGMVLVAAGMGPGFAVGSIVATTGVTPAQQGAAAALLSTSTQVGAAVGLGVLGVLSATAPDAPAGARLAFAAMAAAAALAALLATTLPGRLNRTPVPMPPAVPAHAAGCLAGYADTTGPTQEER